MAKKNFSGDLDELPPVEKLSEADIKKNIVIREDLRQFIPPLWGEELEQLTQNILAEGCRDALILWEDTQKKGKFVLVDGHNRYLICTEYQLDFKIVLKEFAGLDEVKDWMINNQLGKRNMSEEQKSYYRGLQYKQEKKKIGNNQYSNSGVDILSTPQKTHEKLSEIHKVSAKTIQRDEKFAEALDKLVGEDSQLKWDLLSRKINLPKNTLLTLAEQPSNVIEEFRAELKSGQTIKPLLNQLKSDDSENATDDSTWNQLQNELIQNIRQIFKAKDKKLLNTLISQLQDLKKKI